MNRTTLAVTYLDKAHALLAAWQRTGDAPSALIEDALRAVDHAEAIMRRLLDESYEEWQR